MQNFEPKHVLKIAALDASTTTHAIADLIDKNADQAEIVAAISRAQKTLTRLLKSEQTFLRSIGLGLAALGLAASLSACTSVYDRPEGVAPAQWNQAMSDCNREGAAIPTILASVAVDSYAVIESHRERRERETFVSQDRAGNYREVVTYSEHRDRNPHYEIAPRRNEVIRSCLDGKAAELKP